MTPTDSLLHASAVLDRIAATDGDDTEATAAIIVGVAALGAPPDPPGRPTARRHLSAGAFLRSWAVFEPDRATDLEERARLADALAEVAVLSARSADA